MTNNPPPSTEPSSGNGSPSAAAQEGLTRSERDALDWARAYWHLTKNMDLGELADYDDELASEVRERRALAERLVFGEPR